ncbi:hypothetical protein DH2020_023759 [Rehmannia glutinosa]|uniref:Pentatricopeptide repeat-containing protein n=1 Tax=Rehmannia glutinosa TaxID=99300 RepID=A0ABR0W9I3_REHGL
MHHNSVYIDSYALCSSFKSVSCLKNVYFGRMMHGYVEKSGWVASVFVGSALVDFYAKLLCMNDAAMVFDEIPVKNTVCVNALLSGYAEAKMWGQLIELVRRMPLLCLAVDNFTLSAALRACCGLCAIKLGKQVHASVIRSIIDVEADVFLQSLLIEMYGKCGLVDSAKKVFNMVGYGVKERQRDVVLWTSMLGVYGKSGNYMEVIRLFEDMLTEGIRPDGVAFLTVISACGHTGQVDLGMEYFESMTRDYGLVASQEHYSCLVDLLCRAGELERACKLVSEMPRIGDEKCAVSMWGALLSACNECGNVNLGKLAAQRALELEPNNVGVYVLLSNMYARNGMWAEIEQLRELMKIRGLKKEIGWSWIDGSRCRLRNKASFYSPENAAYPLFNVTKYVLMRLVLLLKIENKAKIYSPQNAAYPLFDIPKDVLMRFVLLLKESMLTIVRDFIFYVHCTVALENFDYRKTGDTKDHTLNQWFTFFSEANKLLELAAAS